MGVNVLITTAQYNNKIYIIADTFVLGQLYESHDV